MQIKNVLLISVKPRYADLLFAGQKTVELRRVKPRVDAGHQVVVYASSPVKALIGSCEVQEVITAPVEELWLLLSESSGISKEEFDDYYKGVDIGYGIVFNSKTPLEKPVGLDRLRKNWKNFNPPQSYHYFSIEEVTQIINGSPLMV